MKSVLFVITCVVTFTFGSQCDYPFKFKFDNELFYPIMTASVNSAEHSFKELMLKNAKDQYVTLIKGLPILFTFKNKTKNFKKILLNKDLSGYMFKKEIQKKNLFLKEYSNSSKHILLFVFNKEGKNVLGTLALEGINQTTKKNIIRSLDLNKKNCTKEEYWSLYFKTRQKEYNKKLKLLYSLYFLDTITEKSKKKLKKEIIKVLNDKRKIIDLAIKDLSAIEQRE